MKFFHMLLAAFNTVVAAGNVGVGSYGYATLGALSAMLICADAICDAIKEKK